MAKVSIRDRNKNKFYKDGRKKPANWEWRFEMASVDGKRSHASKSGFKTKKEAELAGANALAEYLNKGRHVAEKGISVSDYLDEWVNDYVIPNLRNNTLVMYRIHINKHIKPFIGHYRLSSLTPALLQDYTRTLHAERSDYTAKTVLRTLKQALKYAVEPMQYIKSNPMDGVVRIRSQVEKKKTKALSIEQWERLIAFHPEHHRLHLPLMIGFYTGFRAGEVIGLTWDDVDFEQSTITVRKQQVRHITKGGYSSKHCLGDTKTPTSKREVTIGETLLELLRREKARQKANRELYREHYHTYDLVEFEDENGQVLHEIVESPNDTVHFVCLHENGKAFNTNLFGGAIQYAKRRVGFDFEFHGLRHTHATLLLEAGVNFKTLQERLGHRNIQTTMNVYTHNTREMDKSAASSFEALTRGQK